MTLVRSCARCGGDHDVEFKPLTHPVVDTDGTTWTHWAPCPVNGEPILMLQAGHWVEAA
jgi:hypothetical protein